MSDKPTIRLFHNMARSGGTMVSKCIGAMERVRLFSEIHPEAHHAAYMNVTDQAHRWYALASAADVAAKYTFLEGVQRIVDRCESNGLQVVFRDWASVDFVGKIVIDDPSYQFNLNQVLAPHFQLQEYALVRHPLDQWLSCRRLVVYQKAGLTLDAFFYGYRKYAEAIGRSFIRYEDFTADPAIHMQQICIGLDLEYDGGFLQRWHLNDCITGDNKKSSRGSKGDDGALIRPLPRREVDANVRRQCEANPDYVELIQMLGYD